LSAEISGLEAESVGVNIGVACVDKVRAKSLPSTGESRKLGPGIRAFPPRGILFPNIRGVAAKDQESTRVDDPYYASCYHKTGRAIARIAHFLLLKKGHSKRVVLQGCVRPFGCAPFGVAQGKAFDRLRINRAIPSTGEGGGRPYKRSKEEKQIPRADQKHRPSE
jgi:hypothetical protein